MTSRIPSVQGVVGGVRARAGRTAARAVNAARLAGGLDRPATGCAAHSVVSRRDRTSLRRFQSSGERRRSPVLLVPSLINRSRIWDLRPGDSFVEGMLAAGYDVYLMDWGTIDERDATNTLSTYVDGYIPSAVDRVEQLSSVERGEE